MTTPECPRLRPFLAAIQDEQDPRFVNIRDRRGLSDRPCRVTVNELAWVQMFDGRRSLREIQAEAIRREAGQLLPLDVITSLVERLDQALLLDGPRFREFLASPVREPACLGTCAPEALRRQLGGLFAGPHGPGLPPPGRPDSALRAALIPHIDYARGGATYAWAFKEIAEHTDASLFVIIGTAHHSFERFTVTRKDFKTPLGIARTDQRTIDRLVTYYGDGLFHDEGAHLPEHSIELEVVFLQYLYDGRKPIRIVPLLVGSFHDCIEQGITPRQRPNIGRMVEALQRIDKETPEPICYIISGDLAHIGPDFGDSGPLDSDFLTSSRDKDQQLCRAAEAVGVERYFGILADEGDRRRVCGMPPTYTLLTALKPARGKLLHYDQYVHPRGQQSVSFASIGFYC
jgi:AmmeMemoRadiSam system protein B